MINPPLISMVMVTYKEDQHKLKRAIDSVLAQTERNWELLIVLETGDPNVEFIKNLYDDDRIVILVNGSPPDRNTCHNLGLAAARGRYIGRIDGDDYTYPDRLAKQLAFLRAHPEVALVGGRGRLLDKDGNCLGVRVFPTTHEQIMRSFALTNPIFHSAVLWDREKAGRDLRYFRHTSRHGEDLELWFRMVSRGLRLANLPDILIDYTQPTLYQRDMQNWRVNLEIRLMYWRLMFHYPRLITGIVGFAILLAMPKCAVDAITRRSWLADRLRAIKSADFGS